MRNKILFAILCGCLFGGLLNAATVTLQPGSAGVDLWITDTFSYGSDYGVDDDKLQVGGWGDQYFSLIRFDVTGAPSQATSATLQLYSFSTPNDGTYTSMYLDRVTGSWDENTGWYNGKPTFIQQTTLPAPQPNAWYSIDITSLYNGWKNGQYTNYGIQLRPTQWCCHNSANFRSSDYSDPAYRPRLVITTSGFSPRPATLIYRPGSQDGIDMWYSSIYDYGHNHFVDNENLQVGGWGDQYWSLLKFDLGCLPKSVVSGYLSMYPYPVNDGSTPVSMNLFAMATPWDEKTGWTSSPSGYAQGTIPAPVRGTWYSVNITNMYNSWQAGTYANYGLALTPTSTDHRSNPFYSSDYGADYSGNDTMRPKLVLNYLTDPTELFRPCFPLQYNTPYLAQINTLMDHSNPSGFYGAGRDGIVRTFDGQVAQYNATLYPGYPSIIGYTGQNRAPFILPRMNYRQGYPSPATDTVYLWYDGHPGYDFEAAWHAPILAASDGILCIATSNATGGSTSVDKTIPWRDSTVCPYGNDTNVNGVGSSGTSWNKWHMFYILHPSGYSTWYLHADDLDPTTKGLVLQSGYAVVNRLQNVAMVGNWGLGCAGTACKHLHFEVRNGMTPANVIDPYGDGSIGSILWGARP